MDGPDRLRAVAVGRPFLNPRLRAAKLQGCPRRMTARPEPKRSDS